MSELRELYQEIILDHYKNPRNRGTLEEPTCQAHGNNPLCGDQVSIYLLVQDGIIEDVRFEGAGCAISTASASLMTEAVKGQSVGHADQLFKRFHEMVTSESAVAELDEEMESLAALAGVREFPIRVKCATMAWHTLHAALHGEEA